MIRYENECVDCGFPCVEYCKYKKVPYYSCDVCGRDFRPDDLFNIDGDMVCEECAEINISYRELLEDLYGTVQE